MVARSRLVLLSSYLVIFVSGLGLGRLWPLSATPRPDELRRLTELARQRGYHIYPDPVAASGWSCHIAARPLTKSRMQRTDSGVYPAGNGAT